MMERVRFIKPWGCYSAGAIIQGPWVFVDPQQLIAKGFAEEIIEAATEVETAMAAPTECAALRTKPPAPKRRRGRPRKQQIAVEEEPADDGPESLDSPDS